MKRWVKDSLVGVAVALVLSATPTFGSPQTTDPPTRWTWFEKTQGLSGVDSIKVWTRCLGAEDSAAHLRLRKFDNGTAVYGCWRGGY